MNVRKIVIAPKTKHVYQRTVLTHALVQLVVKMQSVMPLAIELSVPVHRGCKEILMFLVFLLAADVTLTARIGSNVILTPRNAKSSAVVTGVLKVQNVLRGITRRHAHAFHHLKEMGMFFVHHPLKLTQSLNVALTMTVHPKWPASKSAARTRVCQPIHASRGNNVMSFPRHLAGPLLHALAQMDSCPTTKDTAYQVCHSQHVFLLFCA